MKTDVLAERILKATEALSVNITKTPDGFLEIKTKWFEHDHYKVYTDSIPVTEPVTMENSILSYIFQANKHHHGNEVTESESRQFLKPDKFHYSLHDDLEEQVNAEQDMKFDGDKPNMDLILDDFPDALLAIGDCATFGEEKYEAHSWKSVENGKRRYRAAGFRHQLMGESNDSESGLKHAAHAAWNALAYLQLLLDEEKTNGG